MPGFIKCHRHVANRGHQRVNVINAPALAKARGISLVERRVPDAGRHASLLTLSGSAVVGGTVANGEPRLVRLQEHWLDMAPSAHMLVTHHQDKPGTVGKVGVLLGESDVNISAMYLARTDPRADAYMILALDDSPDGPVADRIRAMDAVLDLWLIRLD